MAKATDTDADQSTPAAWVRDAALLKRIGRFEVRKKLGQGGFGTVYRAFDPQLERDVAVKVPKTELLASPKSVERFLREAKAAARLNHPHIVPVYDAGRDGELNYIASAFIDGQPLSTLIEPLAGDFRRIATLIRQLAEALDYAHSQGVIHRDVKPDNVMIDSAGQPHLMDFGLARIGDAAQKLTHDGTVMGTPAYMSPEQACDDPTAVTHASDQYSLGVVLYELLTGDTPFSGPPAIIIFNTLNQPIPLPRSLRADLPPDLETICLKALSRESSARYATCADFAADLERWLNDEPIQARRTTALERGLRWCKRNPILAGMIGTIAALLVSVAVVSMFAAVRLDQEKRRADGKTEEALEQKQLADKKTDEAIASAETAQQEKSRADTKAVEALEQSEAAKRERDRAKQESRRAYHHYYLSQMNLAQRDWEATEMGNLRERLARTRSDQTDGDDLRGFEWHYWNRLSNSNLPTFNGDAGVVSSVAFSPNGRQIVSGSRDNTVKLWDSVTGQKSLSLIGHIKEIWSVAFSPDGRRIVSASADKTVKVWDTMTGQERLTLKGHTSEVRSAAFSPDGLRIVSGSFDTTLKVWDATTGQESVTLKGHAGPVWSAAFSPDGRRIVSGGTDNTVKVWDATTGQERLTLKGHTSYVRRVAFSPDGLRIVSGSWDNTAKVWDATTGQERLTLKGHTNAVESVAFSHDGRRIVSGSHDKTVMVWDATTGEETLALKGHTDVVEGVAFSPDGRRIVSGSWDKSLKMWDAKMDQGSLTLKGHTDTVMSVAFSPDGQRIVSGQMGQRIGDGIGTRSGDKAIRVWDATTGRESLTLNINYVRSVAFSPDGRWIVSGTDDKSVNVWDAMTGKERLTLKGHSPRGMQSRD